jgi:hypothetical protein
MAQFKVGQRVRKVALSRHCGPGGNFVPVGAEGEIVAQGWEWDQRPETYTVNYDNYGSTGAFAYMLAPLTPPAEDAWAADKVKRVTKPNLYREPAERVTLQEMATFNR